MNWVQYRPLSKEENILKREYSKNQFSNMSEVDKQKLKKIWQKLWKNHYQSMSEKEG